ncbi:hypothetical protein Ahu01nite_020570 [Winogradskya humida]|uniref:Uncharacterized protein n=1 Tax=Winogradskya humida TaxID=113566 RepID=A0ABQ3ZK44_9ACTN|nr:hypothetical protein Ahu01nite_020570 [Actinoplanes humidus]
MGRTQPDATPDHPTTTCGATPCNKPEQQLSKELAKDTECGGKKSNLGSARRGSLHRLRLSPWDSQAEYAGE